MNALATTAHGIDGELGGSALHQAVGRLAEEASALGLHLVDIAGAIQDTAAQSSEQAALIARERFAVGSTDFLTVLDAERELLTARDRLAQSQAGAATTLVAVYKALAGGWDVPSQ